MGEFWVFTKLTDKPLMKEELPETFLLQLNKVTLTLYEAKPEYYYQKWKNDEPRNILNKKRRDLGFEKIIQTNNYLTKLWSIETKRAEYQIDKENENKLVIFENQ